MNTNSFVYCMQLLSGKTDKQTCGCRTASTQKSKILWTHWRSK